MQSSLVALFFAITACVVFVESSETSSAAEEEMANLSDAVTEPPVGGPRPSTLSSSRTSMRDPDGAARKFRDEVPSYCNTYLSIPHKRRHENLQIYYLPNTLRQREKLIF